MLGAGGFGITYLAFDHLLDGPVALKEYFPADMASRVDGSTVEASSGSREVFAWGFDRFMHEARAIYRFRHPNVVRAHRYLEAHGTAYIVMEYVEGESLKAILDRRGRLPADEWRPWMEALMDGLAHMHGHGYLHRDIKPGNIVVRAEDGEPVLIDFGSARVQHRDRTHTQVLTAGYAPIEQYSTGATQGPPTDIYALAAVSYRVLTGDVVPSAPDRVLEDDYEPVTERIAGADRQWLTAIDRGLAVRPEERPRDVAQWRCGLSATAGRDAPPVVAGGYQAEGVSVTRVRAEGGLEKQSLQVGGTGGTALHCACADGPLEDVAALLALGADSMAKTDSGWTPLHGATNPDVAALLLKCGADVLAKTDSGQTPLHRAARKRNPEVVALLLDHGADPMAKDVNGITPLHWATNHGNPEVATLLLDHGADPTAKDIHGATPLHWAVRSGNANVAALLLKRGADPMAKDDYGYTPLHEAGNPEGATLLLDHGADVLAEADEGATPLHRAVEDDYGNPEVAALLLDRGADPMAKDITGTTHLHWAADHGNPNVAALLLDRGADPMAKEDDNFDTPLHWAVRNENPEVAALLLDCGADVLAKNRDGETPWKLAQNSLRSTEVYRRMSDLAGAGA